MRAGTASWPAGKERRLRRSKRPGRVAPWILGAVTVFAAPQIVGSDVVRQPLPLTRNGRALAGRPTQRPDPALPGGVGFCVRRSRRDGADRQSFLSGTVLPVTTSSRKRRGNRSGKGATAFRSVTGFCRLSTAITQGAVCRQQLIFQARGPGSGVRRGADLLRDEPVRQACRMTQIFPNGWQASNRLLRTRFDDRKQPARLAANDFERHLRERGDTD
jgi:hypothetical protein